MRSQNNCAIWLATCADLCAQGTATTDVLILLLVTASKLCMLAEQFERAGQIEPTRKKPAVG